MRLVPLAILASLSASAWLVACGSDNKSTTDGNPGGGSGSGSGSGSGGNGTLTLSGIAKEITATGTTPLPGVALTAYNASDDSMLGSATSGSDGTFSISVHASSVDGYLKATYGTYKTTYLYPPHPLTADYTGVPVFMLSSNTYAAANALLGNTGQGSGNGWIAMLVEDANATPVAGAAVTSTPMGTVGYNGGANNLPTTNASGTGSDGIAYDVNVTAGSVTVSATKTGATFQSHSIKVRPDAVTLTLVTE